MELSILVAAVLDSSSLVDETTAYNYKTKQTFAIGEDMQDDDKIYQWVKDSFIPPDYNHGDEHGYKVNDILFKDDGTGQSVIQVVKSMGEKWIPAQPEDYVAGVDNTFTFSTWSKYYSQIKAGVDPDTFSGYKEVVGGVTHELYRDPNSSTDWYYRLSYEATEDYWDVEEYNAYKGILSLMTTVSCDGGGQSALFYKSPLGVPLGLYTVGEPIPFVTEFTASLSVGATQFRVGSFKKSEVIRGVSFTYYGVQAKRTRTIIVTTPPEEVNVYTTLDDNSIIKSAKCFDTTNCDNSWIGYTFVIRGDKLYVRTAQGIAEIAHVTTPVYAVAHHLKDLTASGFVYLKPTIPYVMLDNKNYTNFKTSGEVHFTIKSEGSFNTLALSGLIAHEVDLLFSDSAGTQITAINNYNPANNRDIDFILPDYKTTSVFYSYNNGEAEVIPKGGTVRVTLRGSYIELGTAQLGLGVNAGFTNLVFQNEFLDLSPVEKDQWHNITYVKGLRINVHSGTVDIPITSYDMMNRLMISIGGETVIINGSGSVDNTPPTSDCIFASTMMVGRMENIKLTTKMKDKEMGEMATYTFKVVENV